MQGKDFIIGTLKSSGCLKTKSEEILLTKIPAQAAQNPESAVLKVAMEDVGKMSMLRGKLSEKEEYALIQIGKLQNFIAEPEYQFDIGKLDVVWRRVQQSVPTYVFEIQIGGNLYQALVKLKHAFEIKKRNNNLDIIWLKEESLEDSGELPEPDDLATEAVEHLQAALDELNDLILELESKGKNSE